MERRGEYWRALDAVRIASRMSAKAIAAWRASPSLATEDAYLLTREREDAKGEELDKARLALWALESYENRDA